MSPALENFQRVAETALSRYGVVVSTAHVIEGKTTSTGQARAMIRANGRGLPVEGITVVGNTEASCLLAARDRIKEAQENHGNEAYQRQLARSQRSVWPPLVTA